MPEFKDLDEAAADDIVEVLGELVVYQEQAGLPKTIRALVEVNVEYRNTEGELVGRFTQFEIRKSEITNPVGATVTYPASGGVVYAVKVPSTHVPLETDGTMAKLLGLP